MSAASTGNRRGDAAAAIGHPGIFAPADNAAGPEWSGARRTVDPRPGKRLQWPTTQKLKRELFATWHAAAMQVIADERGSFRTIAVLWRFINWKNGYFYPTDATLAVCAGGCSEKSISRDIAQYKALGILDIELGWRRNRQNKLVRTRTLHPTFPHDFQGKPGLPLSGIHTDNSGPYDPGEDGDIHTDHACPNHTDNSGLFTLEETLEKERR